MELLLPSEKYLTVSDATFLQRGKDHLHKLGISYIDWKFENIGLSPVDDKMKIFDFDCSGIFDIETNDWIIEPFNERYNFRIGKRLIESMKNCYVTPINLDNLLFTKMFCDKFEMKFLNMKNQAVKDGTKRIKQKLKKSRKLRKSMKK